MGEDVNGVLDGICRYSEIALTEQGVWAIQTHAFDVSYAAEELILTPAGGAQASAVR